jgi:hypothetical protein
MDMHDLIIETDAPYLGGMEDEQGVIPWDERSL